MLGRTLLQTSLVLWLAHQTLQGGLPPSPQTVSWGRVLPARGVSVGVKPGVTGALGALGNRYGSRSLKTGLGRYSGAQLGVGGYRSLGLGGKAGLKQGGYATPGAYGASLGTGLPLGTGLTNGLGLGLGQGAKRTYGTGLGALPGYGALGGIGYPGARPGAGFGHHPGQKSKGQRPGVPTAADLGGPLVANLGTAVQDLKREKSTQSRGLGLEIPSLGRGSILGATAPEAAHREAKSLDPVVKASNLGSLAQLDKQRKILAQGRESYEPSLLERRGSTNHGATLAARGVRQQLPLVQAHIRTQGSPQVQHTGEYDSFVHQRRPNCGSVRDLSGGLQESSRHELLGSETQRMPSLVPRPHLGKESKHLQQAQDVRGSVFSLPQGQPPRSFVSAVADGQAVRDLQPSKESKDPRVHGALVVENLAPSSLNVRVQGVGSHRPASARGTQSLGLGSVQRQGGDGLTLDGQEQKQLTEHAVTKSKALSVPGQTGPSDQASSYLGGAGNYLGTGLGAGGYGTGLGQGAYLGATGKLGAAGLGQGGYPLGVGGPQTGYGDGVTGYLGAMAGNGLGKLNSPVATAGYGNGFSDGYGAGLGYPAELADGAAHKARKSEALSTGAYAGPVQGALGALGTGLESTGGKYVGGAAQVPYGTAPIIPTGLEGDGGYPLAAQQLALGAEGAKTANKYVAGAGFGPQQTGYGAQLGATQDALGDDAGKLGGVNAALGTGYKG
ncbi:uncharacterized protein LOC141809163 [Halichoeres trimaculatus]|uniref:uncharacterized protein LOC141809163 n=1 Tax=Halichoeres trimaculatus TaxID=147232 RepID=UPI003D9FA7A1